MSIRRQPEGTCASTGVARRASRKNDFNGDCTGGIVTQGGFTREALCRGGPMWPPCSDGPPPTQGGHIGPSLPFDRSTFLRPALYSQTGAFAPPCAKLRCPHAGPGRPAADRGPPRGRDRRRGGRLRSAVEPEHDERGGPAGAGVVLETP